MSIDRVTLEILRNHYQAVVEDMARIMERTAYTTFGKETADFSTGLVSSGGEYVAYPWALGASSYLGLNMAHTLAYFDHYDEGDIIICNDAYLSGPLCTHLPDVHILRPIFHGGRIVCWGYAFVHSSDIGGAVPASVWPRATEIFQEGLRLRPTKLFRAGVLQEDVKNMIADNCRIPEVNWGDIKAMVAAVSSCDRRIQEMIGKFGLATVVGGIDAVLDYTEQRARAAIRKIPNGTYRFTEYMEDDLRSEVPVRIQVALTIEGDSIHLDFTGTDPQVSSALNIASHGVTHPFLCQAINAYIVTEDPGIPKASSILRPVRVTAPPGCLVNALFPSPIGVRYGTVLRVFDAVLGALAQALPGRVPAAPAGGISPVVASTLDLLTGQRQVQVVEPMLGGGGGRPGMDGLAVRLDFQVFHPHAIVTARGMERCRLEPWGVAGGRAGTPGSCVVNRDPPRARDIGKVDVLHLEPGDVVSFFSPSGGGHGDPRRRDPEAVRADVRAGFLSVERAREAYGVAVVDGRVDLATTERLRAAMPAPSNGRFDFGARRAEMEGTWTPAIQDAAQRVLESVPPAVRDWGKHQIYDRIREIAAARPATIADVDAAWADIRTRLARALGES